MAKTGVSNRQRKLAARKTPAAPRRPPGEAIVRIAKDLPKAKDEEPRDGLAWLLKKRRLTPEQAREGMLYRAGFKDAGEVELRSSLNMAIGGGGDMLLPAACAMTDAKRQMLIIRYQVLRGQPDMIAAMDGVCGLGRTVRWLAGHDRHRADEMEIALRLALDLIIAWRTTLKQAA